MSRRAQASGDGSASSAERRAVARARRALPFLVMALAAAILPVVLFWAAVPDEQRLAVVFASVALAVAVFSFVLSTEGAREQSEQDRRAAEAQVAELRRLTELLGEMRDELCRSTEDSLRRQSAPPAEQPGKASE